MIAESQRNGLNIDDYLSHESVSRSGIVDYLNSPELYHGRHVAKTIPWKDATPAMRFGTAIDNFLSYGQIPEAELPGNVVSLPEEIKVRRGKKWDEFRSSLPSEVEVWTRKEVKDFQSESISHAASCLRIEKQVNNHELACLIINRDETIAQPSYFVDDWKTRPDFVVPSVVVADLKCSCSVDAKHVAKQAVTFGYDIQGYMATEAHRIATGESLPFALVVVLNEEPYTVEVYQFDEDFLNLGKERFERGIGGIRRKEWRSVSHGMSTKISPPGWFIKEEREKSYEQ